ncbi:nucleotidyltransferase domain-containing protein [Streptomyces sp. BH055]|uniref:nucleotidyltransferase domain-containing protein n=1 Tax=Streptomyces sp. BH055 TaxID=3401173 RepID=UPI003BB5516A
MDHVSTAERLVRDRFPDARAAFLAGSVLTERRTPRSDLDIVVLLSGLPAPCRESLHHEGWPVELFVQTEADWHRFVERETAERRSSLLAMCAQGLLLSDAGLHKRLTDGAAAAMSGSADAAGRFADVVGEILEAAGGRCWAGYRRG